MQNLPSTYAALPSACPLPRRDVARILPTGSVRRLAGRLLRNEGRRAVPTVMPCSSTPIRVTVDPWPLRSEFGEREPRRRVSAQLLVNGPEDAPFDWRQVDWRRVEDDVRRLRQRIFTASKAGDLNKVRSLQKLMLRSRANTLTSVRRVTERNAGRLTAGVDGEVVLTPEAKAKLADTVHQMAARDRARDPTARLAPRGGSFRGGPFARPRGAAGAA